MQGLIERHTFGPDKPKRDKRFELREQHKELYELILSKIRFGGKITLEEIKPIFSIGATTRYNFRYPNYIFNGRDMTEDEIKNYLVDWFFRAIGILVKKGYLKVIPVIDFDNVVDINQTPELLGD